MNRTRESIDSRPVSSNGRRIFAGGCGDTGDCGCGTPGDDDGGGGDKLRPNIPTIRYKRPMRSARTR